MTDIKHTDMLGNPMNVDDLVVCYGTIMGGHPNYPKHGMMFGKVVKLTPKTVLVKCIRITGKEKDEVRVQGDRHGDFTHIAVVNDQMLTSLMRKRLETI